MTHSAMRLFRERVIFVDLDVGHIWDVWPNGDYLRILDYHLKHLSTAIMILSTCVRASVQSSLTD